jgi:type II secretory pathway predicted ATPase ExeA
MADNLNNNDQMPPYIQFYGLKKPPFQPTPDAACYFPSPSHEEALNRIYYSVRCRKGLLVITAHAGLGKTVVFNRYLGAIDNQSQSTIALHNGSISFDQLLLTILETLGSQSTSGELSETLHQLRELLLTEQRRNRTTVLLIDEAHNLPIDTLRNLLLLLKWKTESGHLLQIVLIGRPELQKSLARKEIGHVGERNALRTQILPLTEQQSYAYVQHRMSYAGQWADALFSLHAFNLIVKFGRGVPRQLNLVCDEVLMAGYTCRHWIITRKVTKPVIARLNRQRLPTFSKSHKVATLAAIFAPLLPLLVSIGSESPDQQIEALPDGSERRIVSEQRESGDTASPARPPSHLTDTTLTAAVTSDLQDESRETTSAEALAGNSMTPADKAERAETARLLAVLLDSGRVVVGKAQPKINNPRIEDKGFSGAVFENQLRKEFQTRAGYDLHDIAVAPMPDRAKPLLLKLARLMQKAVQDIQTDINKKGIGFKGFIPATFGTKVAEQFSRDTGLKLRQIGPPGIPPRNPDNKPNEQEEQALIVMQKSHPRAGDHIVEQQVSDHGVRVLLPLFYTRQCLSCHGKPKGELDISGYEKEGFKEGDLGGAISVTIHAENN